MGGCEPAARGSAYPQLQPRAPYKPASKSQVYVRNDWQAKTKEIVQDNKALCTAIGGAVLFSVVKLFGRNGSRVAKVRSEKDLDDAGMQAAKTGRCLVILASPNSHNNRRAALAALEGALKHANLDKRCIALQVEADSPPPASSSDWELVDAKNCPQGDKKRTETAKDPAATTSQPSNPPKGALASIWSSASEKVTSLFNAVVDAADAALLPCNLNQACSLSRQYGNGGPVLAVLIHKRVAACVAAPLGAEEASAFLKRHAPQLQYPQVPRGDPKLPRPVANPRGHDRMRLAPKGKG